MTIGQRIESLIADVEREAYRRGFEDGIASKVAAIIDARLAELRSTHPSGESRERVMPATRVDPDRAGCSPEAPPQDTKAPSGAPAGTAAPDRTSLSRPEQCLAMLRSLATDGLAVITKRELALKAGIPHGTIYYCIDRLVGSGRIKREGSGWRLVEGFTAPRPAQTEPAKQHVPPFEPGFDPRERKHAIDGQAPQRPVLPSAPPKRSDTAFESKAPPPEWPKQLDRELPVAIAPEAPGRPERLAIAGQYLFADKHCIVLPRLVVHVMWQLVSHWNEPVPKDRLVEALMVYGKVAAPEAKRLTSLKHLAIINDLLKPAELVVMESGSDWRLQRRFEAGAKVA